MRKLSILNTRDKKKLASMLSELYGFSGSLKGTFLESPDHELYILTGGEQLLRTGSEKELRIEKAGLFMGKRVADGFVLSVEGAQLIGKDSEQVLELDREQLGRWLKGQDLDIRAENGFYLIRFEDDFFGCAKLVNNTAKNKLGRSRLLKEVNY